VRNNALLSKRDFSKGFVIERALWKRNIAHPTCDLFCIKKLKIKAMWVPLICSKWLVETFSAETGIEH
jgi:hypothetical protein